MASSPLPGGQKAPPDFERAVKRSVVPAVLAASVAVSLVMWVLKPIPHAYRYDLALTLSLALALIWAFYLAPPPWVFKKAVLALVLVAGLGLGLRTMLTPDFNLELVRHYESVFKTIDAGGNPYTSGTVFHMGEGGRVVYGNFNYPPMEIYPYYLAYRLAGTWNSVVFTAAMLFLNALACLAFALMFPGIRLRFLGPYFLVFLFLEVKTNPAMAFLVTALVLLLARRDELRPRPGRRAVIAVLFGVGLMTKFIIIPLMAAYYWHGFDRKNPRSLGRVAVDSGVAMATAVLLMLPFGVGAVLKNTILFNLVMKDRAALATFYPNVLSGPLSWLRLSGLFPFAAVALLGLAVLAAPRLKLHTALLVAAYAFLLVATTPEPQYLVIVLFIALAGQCAALEDEGPTPPGVWKRSPQPRPRAVS
ncbi:MAG TPA: hypothetical protein VMS75_09975 [Terriglobales bacterium]|nr:hypothetical protein [Terriglobales bacterium]